MKPIQHIITKTHVNIIYTLFEIIYILKPCNKMNTVISMMKKNQSYIWSPVGYIYILIPHPVLHWEQHLWSTHKHMSEGPHTLTSASPPWLYASFVKSLLCWYNERNGGLMKGVIKGVVSHSINHKCKKKGRQKNYTSIQVNECEIQLPLTSIYVTNKMTIYISNIHICVTLNSWRKRFFSRLWWMMNPKMANIVN